MTPSRVWRVAVGEAVGNPFHGVKYRIFVVIADDETAVRQKLAGQQIAHIREVVIGADGISEQTIEGW